MNSLLEARNYGRKKLSVLFEKLPAYAFTERSLNKEVDLLLAYSTGIDSFNPYSQRTLTSEQYKLFDSFLSRRANLEPIGYILGTQEFYGIEFKVGPGVLLPRPETETLVSCLMEIKPTKLIDLCTGSGCVGISVGKNLPLCSVELVDLSARALEYARVNSANLANVSVVQSDAVEYLKTVTEKMVLSVNPPYVCNSELLPCDVENFEPAIALRSNDNGMGFTKKLLNAAVTFLPKKCILVVECGCTQALTLHRIGIALGLTSCEVVNDLENRPRVLICEV